jgi:NADH-quinone oxidoreductase subunit I
MKGMGLVKGLAITAKTMVQGAKVQQYPDVKPELPPRSRGAIAYVEENCTVCMLCARECPNWCISIDSHKETVVVPGAARPRQRNVIDEYSIDYALCMYCGICVESCPFGALFWSPEFEYAEYDVRDLVHGKERLGQWARTIPAPQAHDPNGTPSKEETAASKPPKPAAAARPAAAAKPAAARPAADRPAAVAKPAEAKPAVEQPAVAKPAAGEPVAEKPVAPPPTADKPAAEASEENGRM